MKVNTSEWFSKYKCSQTLFIQAASATLVTGWYSVLYVLTKNFCHLVAYFMWCKLLNLASC